MSVFLRRASLGVPLLCLGLGCGSAVKQAAREAAPAAVKESVEQAQKPETRADIAEILADPRIRAAASELSEAVVEGVLNGITDEERTRRLQGLTDALMSHVASSLARSMQRELGPALAQTFADTIDQSMQRVLSAENEQRLQAMATTVARSALQGMSAALLDDQGRPVPVVRQALGQVVQEAGYQAAFGFEQAVNDARQDRGPASPSDGSVLATLGRVSDWSRAVPVLVVGGLLLMLLVASSLLGWALLRLRRLSNTARAPLARS
jgi:hypothetical protein